MIDVLVPVLNRPDSIGPLVDSFWENSQWGLTELVFICSLGDILEWDALQQWLRPPTVSAFRMEVEAGPGDYARKINAGYEMLSAPFMLCGADDLRFHRGWDRNVLEVAETTGVGVIGTNDLGNPTVMKGSHSTHPLVRRSYIAERGGTLDQQPGVVLYEGYGHQGCDTELVTLAKARGQWAFAADSHVEHLHPFWHKSEMDDVYRRGQKTSKADAAIYRQRLKMLRRIDP